MRMAGTPRTAPGLAGKAAKKATNLSIDTELLAAARRLDINLSATLESALVAELGHRKRREWKAEHAVGISAYNERVEKVGIFSKGLRTF
jgi:antitoxin CcdA